MIMGHDMYSGTDAQPILSNSNNNHNNNISTNLSSNNSSFATENVATNN